VSINDCRLTVRGRRAFFPKVETGSTRLGNLKVLHQDAVLTLEQTGTDSVGNWVNTFRIEYEPAKDGGPATRGLNFSGGFVKTSELIKRATTIEYVPLEGSVQDLNLECAVAAPGIDPK